MFKKQKNKARDHIFLNILFGVFIFFLLALFYDRVFASEVLTMDIKAQDSKTQTSVGLPSRSTCKNVLVDTFFTLAFSSKAKAPLIRSSLASLDEEHVLLRYGLSKDMNFDSVYEDLWFKFSKEYWRPFWNKKMLQSCVDSCVQVRHFVLKENEDETAMLLAYMKLKNQELLINAYDSVFEYYLDSDSHEAKTINLIAQFWYDALVANQEKFIEVLPDSVSEEIDEYYFFLVKKAQESLAGANAILELK